MVLSGGGDGVTVGEKVNNWKEELGYFLGLGKYFISCSGMMVSLVYRIIELIKLNT